MRYPPAKGSTRRGRRRQLLFGLLMLAAIGLLVLLGVLAANLLLDGRTAPDAENSTPPLLANTYQSPYTNIPLPHWIDTQLIDVDGAARRGEALEGLESIVVHYIGNAGTSAQQNRNYFNNPDSTVSAHFVIGLEGEVIQCVPLGEKSSASNWRNIDTISIEVCHPDETGVFNQASHEALVRLTAWLCHHGGLGSQQVIRHYDVTGKLCPLHFVENEDAWEQFKAEVALAMEAL